jgi:hypothetical protein
MKATGRNLAILLALAAMVPAAAAPPDDAAPLPGWLSDRGTGLPTSLFGTYIRKGELLVYPFYEYETNNAEEYHPSELGYAGDEDFLGKFRSHEFDLFLGYAPTERLAFELEAQLYTTARLQKSSLDPSAVPARIDESGLGEIESQVRFRIADETAQRPELFSYLEIAYPFQRQKVLIGVRDWAGELGIGAIKGFSWGTLSARMGLAYEEKNFKGGEFALEYLKRLSPRWRAVVALEGEDEDLALITEAQYFFTPRIFLKINSGFGLTQKVPDFAPEIGLMMSFDAQR